MSAAQDQLAGHNQSRFSKLVSHDSEEVHGTAEEAAALMIDSLMLWNEPDRQLQLRAGVRRESQDPLADVWRVPVIWPHLRQVQIVVTGIVLMMHGVRAHYDGSRPASGARRRSRFILPSVRSSSSCCAAGIRSPPRRPPRTRYA